MMVKFINMKKFLKGFTLIEVLVVISIIAILATVLYASFGDARTEARNRAVQAELKEVQLALELYKAQEDRYPEPTDPDAIYGLGGATFADCPTYMSSRNYYLSSFTACEDAVGISPIHNLLDGGFLAEFPDPDDAANPACDYEYYVDEDGEWYKLVANNCHGGADSPDEGIQPENSEFARCPDSSSCNMGVGQCNTEDPDFYNSYAIYSAGGECR
jgi:prepilin-type N-terminal cleavage/methylation domain-containing protein